MKRRHLILPILMLLVVVGFGIFGAMHRSTYTDLTAQPDYIQNFMVAELHETAVSDACQFQARELPNSPIIARVTPTSELEPQCYTSRQQFLVQEVFAGEGLQAGQVIWIGDSAGPVLPGGNPDSVECGYVNIPQKGWEYLVFLSGPVEVVDGFPTLPTYTLANHPRYLINPIFCYQDFGTMEVVPCDDYGTYVPYSQVSGNEFFSTTQEGLEMMLELKHSLLEQYPKESGDMNT